jgi:hypothetical protein
METVSASVISVFSWASTELSQTSILIDVIVEQSPPVDMFTDGLVISFLSSASMKTSSMSTFIDFIVDMFTDGSIISVIPCLSIKFLPNTTLIAVIVDMLSDGLVCSSTLGQHWRTEKHGLFYQKPSHSCKNND